MRAWIVGNGPSLRNADLELLKGEISFATNRIYHAFKGYEKDAPTRDDESVSELDTFPFWRPHYYVRLESTHTNRRTESDDIAQVRHPCVMYLHKGLLRSVRWNEINPKTRVETFHTCQHGYPYESEFKEHDWHLESGMDSLCNMGTSLTVALQIAVLLGFGPLYLLGCDLGYVDGAENHFVEGYSNDYVLRPAADVNRDLYAAHKAAARCSPVPIYNATVGGKLDIYPRVVMEDVLRGRVQV
jgi:hypothetical protein